MASSTLEQLQWRYATKKFDSTRKLSAEKLSVLKESFNLTATSYGLQPLKMVVIQNEALQKSLVPHTMYQLQVQDASHVLVLCVEARLTSEYIKGYFKKVEAIRQTPRAILQPFELFLLEEFSSKDPKHIETWMEKQAYLAMGNLLTVCALEEIDSCPIEGFVPNQYDALLGLEEKGLRSILVLPVGYRAKDDIQSNFKKVRRGTESIIIEM